MTPIVGEPVRHPTKRTRTFRCSLKSATVRGVPIAPGCYMTRIVWQASCAAGRARRPHCRESPGGNGLPSRQREKIIMRIPEQVTERVKEAPAQALRAVFSGVGQVLLGAERIKGRAAEAEHAQPAPAEPVPQPSATTVKDETRWRSLDETGNVRLIPGEDTPKAEPATTPSVPETPEGSEVIEVSEVAEVIEADGVAEVIEADGVAEVVPEPPVTSEPAAVTEQTWTESPVTPEAPATTPQAPAAPAEASATAPEASATSLPVPNYDSLTVPSLRARLRNLDPAQLHTLVDYEKAHAGRADVLTMFERRIAKLESDGA